MERNRKVNTGFSDDQPWNPEPIVPGLLVKPYEHSRRSVFRLEHNSYFAYVQYDSLVGSSDYQKLMMRDGRLRGAMKAFIVNHTEEQHKLLSSNEIEVDHLTVIRFSKSGKSIICEAAYRPTSK